MPTTKHCPRCNHTLPIDAYTRDKNTSDGYAVYCRTCRRTTRTTRTPAQQLEAAASQAQRAIDAHAARGQGVDAQAQRAVTELKQAAERWRTRR